MHITSPIETTILENPIRTDCQIIRHPSVGKESGGECVALTINLKGLD